MMASRVSPPGTRGGNAAVSRTESWLESLAPLRRGGIRFPPRFPPDQVKRLAQVLREGDEVPDVRLVNQDGRESSSLISGGKASLSHFIYTRCPPPRFLHSE